MKIKLLVLPLTLILFVSCEGTQKEQSTITIASSSCLLKIEGEICKEDKNISLEQKLIETVGVISCKIDCDEKKMKINFDDAVTSTDKLIQNVKAISGEKFEVTFLEENVFVPAKSSRDLGDGTDKSDEVSVSDYNFSLPDFSSFFSNFI